QNPRSNIDRVKGVATGGGEALPIRMKSDTDNIFIDYRQIQKLSAICHIEHHHAAEGGGVQGGRRQQRSLARDGAQQPHYPGSLYGVNRLLNHNSPSNGQALSIRAEGDLASVASPTGKDYHFFARCGSAGLVEGVHIPDDDFSALASFAAG